MSDITSDLLVTGHLAVGNDAQVDGGPSGVDYILALARGVETRSDRNMIAFSAVPIWAPIGALSAGKGMGSYDALSVAGPDTGQILSYHSGFSAHMEGYDGKNGDIVEQRAFFAERPNMKTVDVLNNYGVLIRDQGANTSGTGVIANGYALYIEQQTKDAIHVVGGNNHIFGSVNWGTVAVNNNYTAGKEAIILINAASNNVTVTLPSAATELGRTYIVKRIDWSGNTVVLKGAGSDTIDYISQVPLVFKQAVTVTSATNGWFVIANYP